MYAYLQWQFIRHCNLYHQADLAKSQCLQVSPRPAEAARGHREHEEGAEPLEESTHEEKASDTAWTHRHPAESFPKF